ncbi:MAG: hypothetical protein HOP19_00590 [Acidobacteria bacterium]|nr:hypothetical protein [Acidobacteriota bacterium]
MPNRAVPSSSLLKTYLAVLFLLVAATAQTPDKPTASEEPGLTPSTIPQTDDATLNLHRWGAVTLFHGLPSDRVRAIVQDPRGAMWIGTDNGLVRYDGRTMQEFARASELASLRILSLAFDAKGNLWIGTESGAARVRNERLEHLPETKDQPVTGIATNAQNETLVVTAQGRLLRYREAATGTTAQSERGAATQLSAQELNPATHRLLSLTDTPNAGSNGNAVQLTTATLAPNGEFVVGSLGRGVMLHNQADGALNEQLRELALQPPRPYHINALYHDGATLWIGEQSRKAPGLWTYANNTLLHSGLIASEVTAVHGGEGDVWLGTLTQGAYLIRNGQVIEHLTFENTGGGLRSNRINTLYRDREGIVWFGTDRGVCRYDREGFRAATLSENGNSNFVRALLAATNGDTWCATNRGLFRLPAGADLGPWQPIAAIETRSVYALWEDAKHNIWVGTNSGLFVKGAAAAEFTPADDREAAKPTERENTETQDSALTPQQPTPEDKPQTRESIRAITGFRGAVYVAAFERGLRRFVESKDSSLILRDAAAQKAVCLANEEDRALWLGTTEGQLLRWDGNKVERIALPAPAVAVRALAWHGGKLWTGTAQGLFVREGEQWRELLSNVDVFGLLAVNESESREVVWVATNNAGLFKLLPRENATIRFDTEQGLASPKVFALATRGKADNTIWIGTARGLVRHRPSLAAPQLEIRRIVADKIYTPDYLTAELALPHDVRGLLVEATALGSRTFASQYQYEFHLQRLSGQDAKTIRTTTPQFAAEGLRAGPYVMTVRAFSRDLVASEPLTIRLRIQDAPFNRSTALLFALLLATAAIAFWIYRQRQRLAATNASLETTNAELRDTRLRLARETEAERARIARDLHDQTLSDLRNLLVLTDQLPQAKNDTGSLAPASMRRKIESISNEIRHICEDLSPSVLANIGFLPALEWALSDAVAQLPAAEKFAYQFACAPDLEDRLQLSEIEQIQLYRIVQEALSNVARHAQAHNVTLAAQLDETNAVVIAITDDGLGFDGTAGHATGHGLSNIHSRANLIGASVAWERLSPGCRFVVTLGARTSSSAP